VIAVMGFRNEIADRKIHDSLRSPRVGGLGSRLVKTDVLVQPRLVSIKRQF